MKNLNLEDFEKRLKALAEVRGESKELIKSKFSVEQLYRLPFKYPRQIHKLIKCESIEKTYVENDIAYVVDKNKLILGSEIGLEYHFRIFHALKDLLPKNIQDKTFIAALNYAQRYESLNWLPKEISSGDFEINTVVEVGSYLGHKCLRLCRDFMKNDSKYYAIELMPDNFKILQSNVNINNLSSKVICSNYGISDKNENIDIFTKGRQRSGILSVDEGNVGIVPSTTMQCVSLNYYFNANNIENVDFLYITVNGAELKVLMGASQILHKIKRIRIVTKYSLNGEKLIDLCASFLKNNGFDIICGNDTIDALRRKSC